MKSYIYKIIKYFFHHDASDELANRVYQRMIFPAEDTKRDDAVSSIWNELEAASCPDAQIENAFRRVESAIKPKKPVRNWNRVAAIWTIPLLMCALSVYLYYKAVSTEAPKSQAVANIHHYTPAGMREELTLPDGTTVWLNAGSLLIYPDSFNKEERNVSIYGEGFFDVTRIPDCPFIVNAGQLQLEVLGTTFNLSAYLDGLQVKATLETGRVRVRVPDHAGEFLLYPDDQLIYTPLTGMVEKLRVRASDYSNWRFGELSFNDIPLDNVLPVLARTYGVEFHIRNSGYLHQRIRVHFNKDETLENILNIIRVLIPEMGYEIQGTNVYLK